MTKLIGHDAIKYAAQNGLDLSTDEQGGLSIAEAKDIAKRAPETIWIDTSMDPEDGSNVGRN